MHILILSKRNAQAQRRLLRAAEALATYYDLDPDLIAALKPNTKDLKVRGLLEREGAAALVEALAIKVGALEEPAPMEEPVVTAVTDEGEAVEETVSDAEPDDALPPPVLDAETAPADAETEGEEAPAQEIIEEEPEEEPAPKSKAKKSKGSKKK